MPTLGDTNQAALETLPWIGALILLALVLGVAILLVRKWMLSEGSSRAGDGAGLVASLRSARDAGEISQEEYEHALRRIRSRVTGEPSPAGPAARSAVAKEVAEEGRREGAAGERARQAGGADGERRAPPGLDLTGDPLPPQKD